MGADRTLLVVDDDERLRDLLSEYLTGRGHAVVTAPDGRTGLERLCRYGLRSPIAQSRLSLTKEGSGQIPA